MTQASAFSEKSGYPASASFFSAEHVSAGYGSRIILNDISFSLQQGTLTGLLGANGCGKTTLLKSLCGLLPHTGTCSLNGKILETLTGRQVARHISYIPQKSGISVSLPALDVVLMGFHPVLKLLEHPSRGQRETALTALDMVGLKDRFTQDFLTLSEGQKQLCILARTLVEHTKLLLLDEPDSALDFQNRYRILHTLRTLIADEGKAALLCLHDPSLALDFCDQLLLLKDGCCIGALHPGIDSLSDMEYALKKIYGPLTLQQHMDSRGQRRIVMLSECL